MIETPEPDNQNAAFREQPPKEQLPAVSPSILHDPTTLEELLGIDPEREPDPFSIQDGWDIAIGMLPEEMKELVIGQRVMGVDEAGRAAVSFQLHDPETGEYILPSPDYYRTAHDFIPEEDDGGAPVRHRVTTLVAQQYDTPAEFFERVRPNQSGESITIVAKQTSVGVNALELHYHFGALEIPESLLKNLVGEQESSTPEAIESELEEIEEVTLESLKLGGKEKPKLSELMEEAWGEELDPLDPNRFSSLREMLLKSLREELNKKYSLGLSESDDPELLSVNRRKPDGSLVEVWVEVPDLLDPEADLQAVKCLYNFSLERGVLSAKLVFQDSPIPLREYHTLS